MKYSKKTISRIGELVASDSYTIPEVCKIVGISKTTFHEWAKKPEFSELLILKRQELEELVVIEAKRSLMKKVRGFTGIETKTITVPPKIEGEPAVIKEKTVTEKIFAPDTVALIFLLTNKAPQEFRQRQSVDAKLDISGKISELSEGELNQIIDQVLKRTKDGK